MIKIQAHGKTYWIEDEQLEPLLESIRALTRALARAMQASDKNLVEEGRRKWQD